MLIQCEGQEDIVNLDHVSIIQQSQDITLDEFLIRFLKITESGPLLLAQWTFKESWAKDKVLEEIMGKGLSVKLAGDEGIDLSGF